MGLATDDKSEVSLNETRIGKRNSSQNTKLFTCNKIIKLDSHLKIHVRHHHTYMNDVFEMYFYLGNKQISFELK